MIKNAKTFPHHRISSRRFEKMGKRNAAGISPEPATKKVVKQVKAVSG
jgi:hypothetical protein